jgi:hypothetical protein
LQVLEEGTPWANKAELYIGLIKEAVRKDMKESDCPLVSWDYCVERRARINNLTAKDPSQLHGSNAHTATTGDEGDISNLCQYKWYDWCYFSQPNGELPIQSGITWQGTMPSQGCRQRNVTVDFEKQWSRSTTPYIPPIDRCRTSLSHGSQEA